MHVNTLHMHDAEVTVDVIPRSAHATVDVASDACSIAAGTFKFLWLCACIVLCS